MQLTQIAVCVGVAGFLGTAATVRCETVLKPSVDQAACVDGGSELGTICAAYVVHPPFMKSGWDYGVQAKAEVESDRDKWVHDHSVEVYRKDEVYPMGEVYKKTETFTQSEINGKVSDIEATIAAKLTVMRISENDKQDILAEVKASLQSTVDNLRQVLTEEITQSIRNELKAAGVLK